MKSADMPRMDGVFFSPFSSAESPPSCLSKRKQPAQNQTIHQLEPTSQIAFTYCPSCSTCSCCLSSIQDTTWPQSLFPHYSRSSHFLKHQADEPLPTENSYNTSSVKPPRLQCASQACSLGTVNTVHGNTG